MIRTSIPNGQAFLSSYEEGIWPNGHGLLFGVGCYINDSKNNKMEVLIENIFGPESTLAYLTSLDRFMQEIYIKKWKILDQNENSLLDDSYCLPRNTLGKWKREEHKFQIKMHDLTSQRV